VRGLGHNVRANKQQEPWRSQAPILLAASLISVLVLAEGDALYITETDWGFYAATLAYTLAYLAYHLWALIEWRRQKMEGTREPPVFNLAAGALQLVALRLYANAETPYNPVVLLIIGARALDKLRRPTPAHALTALGDSMYLGLACRWAFLPDPAYLVAVAAGASLLARACFGKE
jgi:hypothetical protein